MRPWVLFFKVIKFKSSLFKIAHPVGLIISNNFCLAKTYCSFVPWKSKCSAPILVITAILKLIPSTRPKAKP